MRIKIAYGDGFEEVKVPDNTVVLTVGDPGRTLNVRSALNASDIDAFLEERSRVSVLINDATRPTPSHLILPEVIRMMRCDYEIVVATGTHRQPTEEEIMRMMGSAYNQARSRIRSHDCRAEHTPIGITPRKTPVLIDSGVLQSDGVIMINSIEPHYFSGYTGGRKSLLPGVSAYETVEANHRHALDPRAQSLVLEGNPVHEDMMDALSLFDNPIFSIQMVLDRHHRPFVCETGDIKETFFRGVDHANSVFAPSIDERADLVIVVASPPNDINLYQSQKALDNAKHAVRDGGTIIFISKCREGIGSPTFFEFMSSASGPEEILERLKGDFRLGYQKAAKFAEIFLRVDIWAYTSLGDEVKKIFMKPISDLRSSVEKAIKDAGQDPTVIFMPEGGLTVPRLVV